MSYLFKSVFIETPLAGVDNTNNLFFIGRSINFVIGIFGNVKDVKTSAPARSNNFAVCYHCSQHTLEEFHCPHQQIPSDENRTSTTLIL